MDNNYLIDIMAELSLQQEATKQLFEDYNIDRQKFCVMPFSNIILEPDGNVGVCRHKGSKFTFGNLRHQTLDEIWESERIKEWRNEFLTGEIHVCKNEMIDCKCNQCPELNKVLPYADIHNITNPKIIRLTANFNGKCNLQCQMCDIWKQPNGFYTEENFWIPARKRFFTDILEVDLLSGEPFIQGDTYKLIREISAVNPKCNWTFTTNAHWLLTDAIKGDLDKIIIKNIILSIDSLNTETYHKIRFPGDLSFVLKNIENLLLYQEERVRKNLNPLNLRLNCLIQKDNWHEAKAVIQYCLSKKIIPFLTFLYEPTEHSLLHYDNYKKMEILDFYFETLDKDEIIFIQRIVKPLIRSLEKIDYIYYLGKLRELTC